MNLREWTDDDLEDHVAPLPTRQRKAVRKAWYEAHLGHWLAGTRPERFGRGWPVGPSRDILHAIEGLDDPRMTALLIEAGRNFGKTETMRGLLLRDLLSKKRQGILWFSERAADAHATTRAMMSCFPEYRSSEKASAERILAYGRTPLGRLYPSARWTGGEECLRVALNGQDPRKNVDAVIWARGRGGQIRGLLEQGIRPDLAVADDIVTPETAGNPETNNKIIKVLDDDVAGLGTFERRCQRVVLANAIAFDDVADQLPKRGWTTVRGAVWSPGMPPESKAKAGLFAILRAPDVPLHERLQEAGCYYAENEAAILQGCAPTSPIQTALDLLVIESEIGTVAFSHAYQNLRTASAAQLWPMGKAEWATVDGGSVRIGATAYPLHTCSGAVWLDPRYSEDIGRNDYAAAAAVLKVPTKGGAVRVVVALEVERCMADAERGLYWRAVDALHALVGARITGGYEACGGMEKYIDPEFSKDAARRRSEGLFAPIPVAVPSTQGKYSLDRMGRLAYPIEAHTVCFLDILRASEGVRQCSRLGSGYHDDAPDAIERADNLLTASTSAASTNRALREGRG